LSLALYGHTRYHRIFGNSIILTTKDDPWSFFRRSLTMLLDDASSNGRDQAEATEREEL